MLNDILETGHEKPIAFPEKISSLFELFNNVRQDARGLESNNPEKYIRALDELQMCLISTVIPNPVWGDVKGFIDDKNLDLIEACGDALEAKSKGFIEICPEELDNIKSTIRKLIDEVINCDLPKDVKEKIVSELRKIEEAILNYRIRGVCGVVIASEQSAGGLFPVFSIGAFNTLELRTKIFIFLCSIPSKYRDMETVNRLIQTVGPVLEGVFKNLLPPA